ncbi:hypothetical protein KI387_037882, partial [Taxus chinensis]
MLSQQLSHEIIQPLVDHGDIITYETSEIFYDSYFDKLFAVNTEHTMMTYVESELDDVESGSKLGMMEILNPNEVSGVMDVGVTSSVAHETVTEIGFT